jgi:hypothetical protein
MRENKEYPYSVNYMKRNYGRGNPKYINSKKHKISDKQSIPVRIGWAFFYIIYEIVYILKGEKR